MFPLLSYCPNIHPINCLDDLLQVMAHDFPAICEASGLENPSPLGMWLPKVLLEDILDHKDQQHKLAAAIEQSGGTLLSANGFPMGTFHNQPVKKKVYHPDWSEKSRLDYTLQLGKLASLVGCKKLIISTLSGGWRSDDTPEKIFDYYRHLIAFADAAERLQKEKGIDLLLALEPEPFNTLEDSPDFERFFSGLWFLAQKSGLAEPVKRRIGICLDTCHFLVRFRSLHEVWQECLRLQIPIHKIQLSLCPSWTQSDGDHALRDFWSLDEPIYQHQSYGKKEDGISAFEDLGAAASSLFAAEEWRTHFHIPLDLAPQFSCGKELESFMRYLASRTTTPLLEVETYSLAPYQHLRGKKVDIIASTVAELHWVQSFWKSFNGENYP